MNQTWLGIDPGLAIIGWACLEEVRCGDADFYYLIVKNLGKESVFV